MKNDFIIDELSVFLPCYNEEDNLENTYNQILPTLTRIAKKWELVIVNDGSKDKTAAIAAKIQKQHPDNIKIITHNPNRGYGAAFKSGLYNSSLKWIILIDADGQFNFDEAPHLIDVQKNTKTDMVVGYYLGRKVPFVRKLGSSVWQLCVFFLFGLRVRDIDCGFKLISKKVVDTIPKLEAERGPFITSEFLVKSKRAGFKIAETGVNHYERTAGEATGAKLNVVIAGFTDLFRLWIKMNSATSAKS